LPDGAFVLDVGTGPGRVPLLIAERCPSLVVEGIDLSEQMIARALASAARVPIPSGGA
jgi:ubiquinone/menaquinone biosynthesis C-methylase UbiE